MGNFSAQEIDDIMKMDNNWLVYTCTLMRHQFKSSVFKKKSIMVQWYTGYGVDWTIHVLFPT